MTTETVLHASPASSRAADAVFRRVLLPVDFSEASVAAAEYARRIAAPGGACVTLLHVRCAGVERDSTPRERSRTLDRIERVLGGSGTHTVLTAGDPATEISRYVAENGSDLVVMPTRGMGAMRRLLLGSVTAGVLANVDCPVLTMNADAGGRTEDAEFRHVVCAVDLGADSAPLLRRAAAIAESHGAEMSVLHVSPRLQPVVGVVHDREWCAYLARILREETSRLTRREGVDAPIHMCGGEPARGVARVAAELNADLLVIGRHRPRGLFRRLRGNTYAIVAEAPCPVLSV